MTAGPRRRALLIALAPLALAAAPARATVFLTVPQAQALMAPGATAVPDFRTLSDADMAAITRAGGTRPLSRELKAWRLSTGGWFIVDQVVGKHEFITFAVTLDAAGAVRDVEILDYRESYGGQVRDAAWRRQFVGKRASDSLTLDKDIRNISGATLSSRHVTDGVRRLLATHARVLATVRAG